MAELAGILDEVKHGARLLYDGLSVHSLGEDQLCEAVVAHLGRPCIVGVERLLGDLASAAALDVVTLQWSSPSLMQKLECCAAEVQTAIQASRDYWLEMGVVLAEQHKARPARLCVVRSSQCLHRGRRRLAVKGWQPCAYNPDTRPALRRPGARCCESRPPHRSCASDIDVVPADEDAERSPSRLASCLGALTVRLAAAAHGVRRSC